MPRVSDPSARTGCRSRRPGRRSRAPRSRRRGGRRRRARAVELRAPRRPADASAPTTRARPRAVVEPRDALRVVDDVLIGDDVPSSSIEPLPVGAAGRRPERVRRRGRDPSTTLTRTPRTSLARRCRWPCRPRRGGRGVGDRQPSRRRSRVVMTVSSRSSMIAAPCDRDHRREEDEIFEHRAPFPCDGSMEAHPAGDRPERLAG